LYFEGSGISADKVEEVRARLEAARAACQPPATEPDPVVTAEPPPFSGEGAGALEILRDAQERLQRRVVAGSDGELVAIGVASGDHRSASVVYELEFTNYRTVVPTSRVTVSSRMTFSKFASDEEARPLPQPGEEVIDEPGEEVIDVFPSWYGFPYLRSYGSDNGKTHATMRFSIGSIRIEIVSEMTSFTVLRENLEYDPSRGYALRAAEILGSAFFIDIDRNL
jgi:hypothetical protein